jgi:putative tricarboxylic transport membrane protein
MRLGRDGAVGLIGLSVSLLLLPQAFGLPRLSIVPIGPGFYPTLVLVFMAVVSAILLLQGIVAQRHTHETVADAAETAPARAYDLVAAAFAVITAYIVLLPLLGFRIATVAFVAVFQALLERPSTPRQWTILAAVAIGTSIVTYIVFERYLLVLLPRGAWTGW